MSTTRTRSFGIDGVDRAATQRPLSRLVRRLLVLVGLTLGCWLVGAVLHSATASATATAGQDDAGGTRVVSHSLTAVSSLVDSAGGKAASSVRTVADASGASDVSDVSDVADAKVGPVRRTVDRVATHVRTEAVPTVIRTAPHIVTGTVRHTLTGTVRRTVTHLVGRTVTRTVGRIVARTITPVPAPTGGQRGDAVQPVAPAATQTDVAVTHRPDALRGVGVTAIAWSAGAATSGSARAVPAISISAVLGARNAPISRPLDAVPSAPPAPQPLPFSLGGSIVAAGGLVSSGHEIGATLPARIAVDGAQHRLPRAAYDVVPAPGSDRQPGFCPD